MCKASVRVFLLGSGVRMRRRGVESGEEERVKAGQWERGFGMREGGMATKRGEGREGRRRERRMERK